MPTYELTADEAQVIDRMRMTPEARAVERKARFDAMTVLARLNETASQKARREAIEAMKPDERRAYSLLKQLDYATAALASPEMVAATVALEAKSALSEVAEKA